MHAVCDVKRFSYSWHDCCGVIAIVSAACLSSQLLLPNPFATTTVNLIAVEQEKKPSGFRAVLATLGLARRETTTRPATCTA